MFWTLGSLSHALVNYSQFLSMHVIDVKPLDNLVFGLFCLENGVWAQSQSSSLQHVSLSSAAARLFSSGLLGGGTGLATVCTPGHCVQLSTVKCSSLGSRRKVREIETWATRAFRRRKQVETVRMKRIGAALAQGCRWLETWWWSFWSRIWIHTVSRHLMTEGILKYSRFCDKNILMIHFLLLCQNYPLPDKGIHQKNLCSRSSKI